MFKSLLLLSSLAAATPVFSAELSLTLTGDEANGMPAFEVLLGEEVLGKGTLDRIDDAGQTFAFEIPDDGLHQAITVRFTNDYYEEEVGDRNLVILGASIGDTELGPEDFEYIRLGVAEERDDGRLNATGVVAVAAPPEGGWDVGQVSAEVVEAEAAPDQPTPAPKAVPLAAKAASDDAPAEHAEQAAVTCDAIVVLTGYANEQIHPGAPQLKTLAEVLNSKGCAITVTGYSSTSGPAYVNQWIATERAKAAMNYLTSNGGEFSQMEIVGSGETEQFGSTQADNRRVVVEIK